MNREKIKILVRLVLTIVLLAFVLSLIDLQDLLNHLLHVNLVFYGLGLLCYFGFIALWAVRWYFIIRVAGEQITLRRAFVTTLVGNFFAIFLPEVVGSDLARMYEVGDERGTNANIVSTVLLDRVIGLVSLIIMAFGAFVVGSDYIQDRSIFLIIGGLLVGFVIGWVLFFNQRFMNWVFKLIFKLPIVNRFEQGIHNLYAALFHLHNQPRLLISTLLLSLVVQLAEVVAVIFAARASNIPVSPAYFFLFLPMIWLITILPISISGLGVREGAFVFFFSQVGVASPDAVALSLLYYSYKVISGLVGGLVLSRSAIVKTLRRKAVSKSLSTQPGEFV